MTSSPCFQHFFFFPPTEADIQAIFPCKKALTTCVIVEAKRAEAVLVTKPEAALHCCWLISQHKGKKRPCYNQHEPCRRHGLTAPDDMSRCIHI